MKFIFNLIFMFSSFLLQGQWYVGNVRAQSELSGLSGAKIYEEDIKALKASKTLFLCNETDPAKIEKLDSLLKSAWDFTEIRVVHYADFTDESTDGNYSVFSLGGYYTQVNMKTISYGYTHIYLNLTMKVDGNMTDFCRIVLTPTTESLPDAEKVFRKKRNDQMQSIYEDVEFQNWHYGLLKNALQAVNRNLTNNEPKRLYGSVENPKITMLKTDTLFIHDYGFTADEEKNKSENRAEFAKRVAEVYPYPFKILPIEEISDRIIAGEKFCYLLDLQDGGTQFTNIINSADGEVIYSRVVPGAYGFRYRDFKLLNDEIEFIEKKQKKKSGKN